MPRCISPRYCQSWRAIIIGCRALHTRRLTAPSDAGPAHTPLPGRLPDKHWRQRMKTPIALALFAILAFATSPAGAAERACRPSLSNFYHCPDTSAPATKPTTKTTKTASPSGRACRPSLSNLWTCPGTSQPSQKSREDQGSAPPRKTASTPERGCRPSLSNGYKCPGEGQAGANQYSTETLAWAHCPADTVVWANTRSNVYHFRGNYNYGNTKAGAYMCEHESLAEGMRAAKNEKHP